MPSLTNRVAFITGAARGIGKAIAMRFAADGAQLALMDINRDELKSIQTELGLDLCEIIVGDVSNETDIINAVKTSIHRYGHIDILVNNAYYATHKSVTELSLAEWQRTMDVCLTSIFFTCQNVIPHMQHQRHGTIINLSSVQAHFTVAGASAYAAAKGAILSFTKQMAVEYGSDGIRANAICPGFIATEALFAQIMSNTHEAKGVIDSTPLRRAGTPADVAAIAAFLASNDAAFVTGTEIIVDGGVSAQWPMMLLRPALREKAKINSSLYQS